MRGKIRFIVGLVITSVFLIMETLSPVYAMVKLPSGRDDEFAENNILFYNPSGGRSNCGDPTDSGSGGGGGSGSGNDRLKEIVRQYGEFAMDLQRKYGSPWEVIFAQMLHESGVGTAGVAASVAKNGYYNWLGITGTGGSLSVGTPYISPSGRKWAQYPSIKNMMEAWAGTYVLRNGAYDDAFQELDPNHYNLHAFLVKMIHHYAPSSDGNDEAGYVSAVESTINGAITEVRKEKGWPSSAELAKKENIQIGGEMGMSGSKGGDKDVTPVSEECPDGDLQKLVLDYAWPEYHAAPYITAKEAYSDAVKRRSAAGKYVGGISYPGIDCGGFVTTLLQDSGYASNYNDSNGATGVQESWAKSHGWTTVTDIAQLSPGDVAFTTGHTFVYVGKIEGFQSVIASASLDERAPMAGHESIQGARWYHCPNCGSSGSVQDLTHSEEKEEK